MIISQMIYYITLVLCCFLILDVIFTIVNSKYSFEWKIVKFANTFFLVLLFLSVNRLIQKMPNDNIFDYLIVVFNGGLFIVGTIASQNIMKS